MAGFRTRKMNRVLQMRGHDATSAVFSSSVLLGSSGEPKVKSDAWMGRFLPHVFLELFRPLAAI
jgi:hypothetical protein